MSYLNSVNYYKMKHLSKERIRKLTRYGLLSLIATLFQALLIQAAQAQSSTNQSDPLIAGNLDKVLYVGLLLLGVAILFAINTLSHGLEKVLVFALVVSAIAIVVIVVM